MTFTALTRTSLAGIGLATIAMTAPSAALAQDFMPDIQPLSIDDSRTLPPELQTAPVRATSLPATSIGPDGVETITRTRRIASNAPYAQAPAQYVTQEEYDVELPPLPQGQVHANHAYAPGYNQSYAPAYAQSYAPGAQVFQREQWIAECERRTDGHSGRRKGGIIGGLLGAVAGGILGNRVFDSERLGGTLLGVGVGGIGGALLGSLIGGGRNDRGEYDCEAALDAYLSQYAAGGTRIASRTIPGPAPVYAAPAYAYAQPQYYYQPPQQVTYVPIEYQQRQRVIVRETVREEVIPGARRTIPAPPPPVRQTAPIPIKGQPRYIKGN